MKLSLIFSILSLLLVFNAFSEGTQEKIQLEKQLILTNYNLKVESYGMVPAEELESYLETFMWAAKKYDLPSSPYRITLKVYNDFGYRDVLPHNSNIWNGGICLIGGNNIRVSSVAPRNTVHFLKDLYELRSSQESIDLWDREHTVGPFTLTRISWGGGCGGMPSDDDYLSFIHNFKKRYQLNSKVIADCLNPQKDNVNILVNNDIYFHYGRDGRKGESWIVFSDSRTKSLFRRIIRYYCDSDH